MLPRLIVITDWELAGIEDKLRALCVLGARIAIQHRAARMDAGEFERRAEWLAGLGMPLFINGKQELAARLGVNLHLPDGPLTAASCRARIGDGLISVAVHRASPDPVGADLALISPVFAPGSKPDDTRPTLGPEGFERRAATLPCPAYALGGISSANLRQLPSVAGVAVISSVLKAADPVAAARELLVALEDGA